MERRYKVVVVGMGKRGMHHASAFQANSRFEVAGVCDIDSARADAAAAKFNVPVKGTDVRQVAGSPGKTRAWRVLLRGGRAV